MNDLQKQTCISMVNIFESSSVTGNYGAIGGLKNDKGHLSYGRSQVSLASGNLFLLIKAYCEAPDAQFSSELSAYLPRLGDKDFTLDTDLGIRALLREAGHDPAMQRVQDDYLDRNFFQPAIAHAVQAGLTRPLSQAIVYDTHIQGGWAACSHAVNGAIGTVGGGTSEEDWIKRYLEVRTNYLTQNTSPPTTYRPEAYSKLVADANWDLNLSITFRGVNITALSLGGSKPDPIVPSGPIPDPGVDNLPLLRPRVPYTRGPDVLNLQKLLNAIGMKNSLDQIYGPFTQALVTNFQRLKGLKPDGIVGPQTWAALAAAQST